MIVLALLPAFLPSTGGEFSKNSELVGEGGGVFLTVPKCTFLVSGFSALRAGVNESTRREPLRCNALPAVCASRVGAAAAGTAAGGAATKGFGAGGGAGPNLSAAQ
jgi:hypothetical protein